MYWEREMRKSYSIQVYYPIREEPMRNEVQDSKISGVMYEDD